MTPREHYAEAERLLAEYALMTTDATGNRTTGYIVTPPILTEAGVHATLACAPDGGQ
jgi:hypothetical protein